MFKFVVLCSLVACALGAVIPDGMLPQLDGRIVGGQQTTIGEYPYMVSLLRSGSHFCGGSLYSSTVIVSAAHCLINTAASSVTARLGSTYYNKDGIIVAGNSIVVHPNYSSRTMENDVALLKLKSALTVGGNIRTIPLAGQTPADGSLATVTGWGTTSSGGSVSAALRVVNVKIVNLSKCKSAYKNEVLSKMICASDVQKDSCQGDSGGPLVVGTSQVGIVSWGYGCADPNYPGVYANVADLKSWIQNNA